MRIRAFSIGSVMASSLLLGAVALWACGADSDPGATRVAVQNAGETAMTVDLRSPTEVDAMSFSAVSAGTTSAFRNVNFETISALEVVVTDGTGTGGSVTLTPNADNTLVVSADAAPVVQVSAPPAGSSGGGAW